jgi:hypothetical protein
MRNWLRHNTDSETWLILSILLLGIALYVLVICLE